jgi:1,4-alpha-glucan branching enzyme
LSEKKNPVSAPSAPDSAASSEAIALLRHAEHPDPFSILGPHLIPAKGLSVRIRAFRPDALGASILLERLAEEIPATKLHPDGYFEAIVPVASIPGANADSSPQVHPSAYRWKFVFAHGGEASTQDPYAFPPVLTPFDLYLMGEGTHYLKYEKLGAHIRKVAGVSGVHFAVWAPDAQRVSVVGDFNRWDGRIHPMRNCGPSGVWEIFLPELGEGLLYKFEIRSRFNNFVELKSDPYGFAAELRPKTSSIVCEIEGYDWGDADWMDRRAAWDWKEAPISIYEVHLGAWRHGPEGRWLTYRELAGTLIPFVKELGYTHIEILPMMEHPYDGSWGYQTVGYYAPTSRYGSPKDFMYFVDACHRQDLGVLLDWTPGHFPRDAHGLAYFDGTHLYEHADPRLGTHPDWGTLVFNYGRHEVQNFLVSNALFWLDKYHADGLRVDAVASMLYLDYSRNAGEWLPNRFGGRENLEAIEFIKHLNEVVHSRHPGALMIAEESTAWPAVTRPTYLGGLGFDLKWNMGWMNDTLRYFGRDPIHRKFHHNELTFSLIYAFNENFILPLSHDEIVHGKRSLFGKMPGDDWRKFAGLRLLYSFQYTHPGKKLLFMGGELSTRHEWSETRPLEWELLDSPPHAGVFRALTDLNHLYSSEPALHQIEFSWGGFEWLDVNDADSSILSFLRRAIDPNDFLVVVANFTPLARENYRIGVPSSGVYTEIFNSDSSHYGGSNYGNLGAIEAEESPWNDRQWSLTMRIPPLATLILKPKFTV